MSVARRRLLMGRGGGSYVDNFTALSSRWIAQAGSLAVSGGALQAATLGSWLNNLLSQSVSEFSDGVSGFVVGSDVVQVHRDFEVDPAIAPTGGADNYGLEIESTADGIRYTRRSISTVTGAGYHARGRVYSPSANTSLFAPRVGLGYGGASPTAEDIWELTDWCNIRYAPLYVFCRLEASISGDKGYFDSIDVRRVNAPALLAGWLSPNHVATLHHVSPATGVVPFGYICRYTDSLNYWEVRVLPNTAGNDLQIIQVTDGVETTRAEADVDWTSDDTDELEVTCAGSTISTAYRKAGAGVWTAGPSYASATQGQTSPKLGVMLYEAGVGRLSGFDVRRA